MDDHRIKWFLEGCASIVECPTRQDLYEEALIRGEACVGADGQLCVVTGEHTGRAADDKYIVESPATTQVAFGLAGKPLALNAFNALMSRVQAYLIGRRVYVVDFVAGSLKCRVITEYAWQGLFVSNLFQTLNESFSSDEVDLTIVAAPGCNTGDEATFRSKTAIACNFDEKLIVIVGTAYAGEIKKSVFTYASYVTPKTNCLPMHSSVTATKDGRNTAVFFGLSGTGKTTLSAESSDPDRMLLGDDEHVWHHHGIYNIESGCYAKAINLTSINEPGIYNACRSFMTVLENVMLDKQRLPDFSDSKLTENTRAAYPLSYINRSFPPLVSVNHPSHIIMLTCDAYGILPSVAKLTKNAAVYHFLSGYTAKIAGTEAGIKEPKATFSRCFGSPFMPYHASTYADLLSKKLDEHQPTVWLVNTGWVGGPYGVGHRIDINITRQIVDDILSGELLKVDFVHNDVLNVDVPVGIPFSDPTWDDTEAYKKARDELVKLFHKNALETMQGVDEVVLNAAPRIG